MTARPRVLVNFASSIDGKIAPAPGLRRGPFTMSRHPEDHRRMRELRASADAVLIGAGNLLTDDPDLALAADERARRRAAGAREPLRMVVTRRGDGIDVDRKMFDPALGGPAVVAHSDLMPSELCARLSRVATLVALGETEVAIPRLLAWLAEERGVATLLCEGGGVLCGRLFEARVVDQLFLTIVPRVLGGTAAPTLAEGRGFLPDEIEDARLGAVERVGDELYLRFDFEGA